MSTKFAVIAVWAEDVLANVHFYRDVLGLELLSHHGSRPHIRVGGVYLTVLKGSPMPAQNADPDHFPLFALSVENLDEMVKRLEEYHIALPWGVGSGTEERWVMFHDLAGNLIELVQFGEQK
ncbi:MAG TPA: VOC family protein [Anaerolineales bacterium]|nr:VOC family protein [Anaerolineales bacterium]